MVVRVCVFDDRPRQRKGLVLDIPSVTDSRLDELRADHRRRVEELSGRIGVSPKTIEAIFDEYGRLLLRDLVLRGAATVPGITTMRCIPALNTFFDRFYKGWVGVHADCKGMITGRVGRKIARIASKRDFNRIPQSIVYDYAVRCRLSDLPEWREVAMEVINELRSEKRID